VIPHTFRFTASQIFGLQSFVSSCDGAFIKSQDEVQNAFAITHITSCDKTVITVKRDGTIYYEYAYMRFIYGHCDGNARGATYCGLTCQHSNGVE
jgi:hypothetical protein